MKFIKKFRELAIKDVAEVGGKNASLGEMYNELSSEGVLVPDGFATTSEAFWIFIRSNNIEEKIKELLKKLDRDNFKNLSSIGAEARQLILSGNFSKDFSDEIISAYGELGNGDKIQVAVRSSATAEDLPNASFAGQHDTFLNIKGAEALLNAVKDCFASLYTNRAIKYREDKGFLHHDVALSVGVQKMVRSDIGCSGIGFSLEPESGFKNIIHISGVWGLGENIVQGLVNPDEFDVFKPMIGKAANPIIQKKLGHKELSMVYAESSGHSSTVNIETPMEKQDSFVLSDAEVIKLSQWILLIEKHYNRPMDVEWAKDGLTNDLYITQARPETVHKDEDKRFYIEYHLKEKGEILTSGSAIGSSIATGKARYLKSPEEGHKLNPGEILITNNTSPDWDPLLKLAAAVVTERGGRTSHAAIVARELGVPAIVGTNDASQKINDGEMITVSCEGKTGFVYKGALKFDTKEIDFGKNSLPKTEAKFILSDPDRAFQLSFYPNNGVGLLRMEFIIMHKVKIHPMALVKYDEVKEKAAKKIIDELTWQFKDKRDFFVEELSRGIAVMAAAFYPKEVIVRLSDFKSNEYANLIGGRQFEPLEENPMLGFRGAARYYHPNYKEAFELECKAIKRVREEMGLDNLKVMIPFCRTINEAKSVIALMKKLGLERGKNSLEIYMMVEIPSNVILLEKFAEFFDGFSIGSNDLTQLTLGVDRDSELMAGVFDENNEAAKEMIATAIQKARKVGKKIGLCGQAPSDFPEFATFLVRENIDSISFNPDALLKGIENINHAEAGQ
ncbi:phosphoenolpyruvate synthase [Salegentibacter salegens]|uniref:Phosphoenolpyruvate synthase n=1 Tax=Salegentibacter salegens TaxID=143223 RepID=A0A1M7NBV6_9FLAO|nr:phosphoenolpyruvate synthase [Salegentibacter salegens]PRX42949.1 phosphoenolpyruvate synthase [Salegentibacter salegens]SHN01172.1 phosphoenolpyruvate synthase [Salegentibacter salegens]